MHPGYFDPYYLAAVWGGATPYANQYYALPYAVPLPALPPRQPTPPPPPPRPGLYSYALSKSVVADDTTQYNVLREMKQADDHHHMSTYTNVIDCPLVAREAWRREKCKLTVSWDPQEVDLWVQEHAYTRKGGDLLDDKVYIVYIDMEQSGTPLEMHTGSPALIQIGIPTPDDARHAFAVLFAHVWHMDRLPSTLLRLFADTRITKMFHGFRQDLIFLNRMGIDIRTAVQINSLARLCFQAQGLHHLQRRFPRLKELARQFLNIDMDAATDGTYWDDGVIHP
ncbi:hypothetical protein HK097_001108 [Rhizophlyctis rosea]|uniref:3'-5' exonuclease domain-containing protein n=1 Tax=Rhizophlyctis rosea TaxID=64517 RepID=A0AAD5X1K4_9FUNG|nr:hypothetical protein HK097_001108 [Rhizophlyctis rosea]